MKITYAVQVYQFPGHPFPKFWDGFTSMEAARKRANQALLAGWKTCDIYKYAPTGENFEHELLETLRVK